MKEDEPEKESFRTNIFDKFTNFVDTYIREIRYGLYGLGFVSVVIISRNIYATKIITCASDIPQEFIKKGVKLQGQVEGVGSRGILYVKHHPLLRIIPNRWRSEDKAVPLHLSFVDVTPIGSKWLQDHLITKHVWFQIMSVSEGTIWSSVHMRKKFRFQLSCVNVDLVKDGLCRTWKPSDVGSMTKHEHDLMNQLLQAESIASKSGKGMWKVEKIKEKETKKVKTLLSKILYLPVNVYNWMRKRRK